MSRPECTVKRKVSRRDNAGNFLESTHRICLRNRLCPLRLARTSAITLSLGGPNEIEIFSPNILGQRNYLKPRNDSDLDGWAVAFFLFQC